MQRSFDPCEDASTGGVSQPEKGWKEDDGEGAAVDYPAAIDLLESKGMRIEGL